MLNPLALKRIKYTVYNFDYKVLICNVAMFLLAHFQKYLVQM